MFTAQQIREEHAKVKSGADYPRYIQTLRTMGVTHYVFRVTKGVTIFHGQDHQAEDSPRYDPLFIAATPSKAALVHAIAIHQKGDTDFRTFCQMAAAAGVEEWIADLSKMAVLYVDHQGNTILEEPIPTGEYTPSRT